MMQIVFFYIPVAGENDGVVLGRRAIELQLAACANVFPIQSFYFWKESIQRDTESVLILKTLPEKAAELATYIEQEHTYDTPCILRFSAEVNDAYGAWMKEVLHRTKS